MSARHERWSAPHARNMTARGIQISSKIADSAGWLRESHPAASLPMHECIQLLRAMMVEAPGIEPDQRASRISTEIADSASTQLDFDSIEPASFHLDPSFGTRSGDIRAT
jgi:hypothetical protein